MAGRNEVNVRLQEDGLWVDEVVVLGYGMQKKSKSDSAVTSTPVGEIRKQVAGNPASALQGFIPGVEVFKKAVNRR